MADMVKACLSSHSPLTPDQGPLPGSPRCLSFPLAWGAGWVGTWASQNCWGVNTPGSSSQPCWGGGMGGEEEPWLPPEA